jgi:two-component system sensor histidine kinase/response regulator
MDIQMPVMDGYEATRRIGEIAPELPVVGQTAHVLALERETCLAAGMVDHLAKPIDIEELVAVVLRYAGKREASIDKPGPKPSSIHAAASDESNDVMLQIDWQALAARFGGDLSFIDKLAASLLRTHADAPIRLREAARARDLPTLAFLTHNIKGVIGNLMAPPLYDLARQAEDAARNQQPQAVTLADALTQPLEHLLAQAGEYLNGRDA